MGSKAIKVPDAGVTDRVGLTGRSVIILNAPDYSDFSGVPKISFGRAKKHEFPVATGNQFQNPDGENEGLLITGTAESAGDTIHLLTSDLCLDTQLSALSGNRVVKCGETFSVTVDDTVQQLSELALMNDDNELPTSIYIYARGADIIYTFDIDPDQNSFGKKLKADAEQPTEIKGIDFIEKFRFIDDVSGNNAELIVTPEY